MRSAPVLAVIIGAAAVISGCGNQQPGGSGGGAVAPRASATASPPAASSPATTHGPPVPASPATPVAAAACDGRSATHGRLTLTNADDGESFCVKVGTNVVVYLRGSTAHKWQRIFTNSSVLTPSEALMNKSMVKLLKADRER